MGCVWAYDRGLCVLSTCRGYGSVVASAGGPYVPFLESAICVARGRLPPLLPCATRGGFCCVAGRSGGGSYRGRSATRWDVDRRAQGPEDASLCVLVLCG